MAKVSQDLPICSRLLGRDEVELYLKLASEWARLADSINETFSPRAEPLDQEELRQWREEATRHREFRWAIQPGDRVWLTANPSNHPEVEFGIPFLVVVRGGQVVARYRPANGSSWPILPSTKRLTRDEVIAIASEWVRARYPVIPAVALVQEIPDRAIDEFATRSGGTLSSERRRQLSNVWMVIFATTWDTDDLGMPVSLHVVVDDETGLARPHE